MTHTTESLFTKKNIEKFSDQEFVHVVEVVDAIGITTKGIIQHSLAAEYPLYVMLEKGWKLGVVDPDSDITHSESYTLLKLNAADVATLFANDVVEVSDFNSDSHCHLHVLSTSNENGIFIPANTVKITIDKLIIMYRDLITFFAPMQHTHLGEIEKANLLKSIAALAYTTAYFYNKTFDDGKLGEEKKIKVSPLVDQVLMILSELDLKHTGLAKSSLQERISEGMKLIKKL